MSLTVNKISQVPRTYSFKGNTEPMQSPEIKDNESKLSSTLACLAALGAGAITAVYAFKRGKAAGLKEGSKAVTKAGETVSTAASNVGEAMEKIKVRGPLKTNPIYDIRTVKIQRPDGTFVRAAEFKKDIVLNGRKVTVTKTVDAETGKTISVKRDRNCGIDNIVTVKESVIENGQKVTKKHEYRDGKIYSTISSFYDSKTGVLKKTVVYGEGNPPLILMKDKNGYKISLGYANNNGKHYVSSIHLKDPKGNDLLDDYGNSTIEQARAVIKEYNLPFEI